MIYLALGYLLPLYIIFNLLRKVENLTEQTEKANADISQIYQDLNTTFSEMKVIDAKGGFEADDEVGTTFKNLKEVIDQLEVKYGINND
tara:strand:+ start:9320 stop:9586 length:267 start_codon:yes stop_codon:yes gene_type:complete